MLRLSSNSRMKRTFVTLLVNTLESYVPTFLHNMHPHATVYSSHSLLLYCTPAMALSSSTSRTPPSSQSKCPGSHSIV